MILEEFFNPVVAMAKTIEHRGPDSGRSWVDVNNFIAFTHNRLSIIDLSANGSRPMYSATKRFVMVVNGEIHSFKPTF